MSDTTISIPGVTASKYGTDKLIEGLMKIERVPRDREQTKLDSYQKQQAAWQDLSRNVSSLRDAARGLYSFRNPFSDRVAKSSDETVLTATATREALEQTRKVGVERIATADRLLSSNLPKDYKVPAGEYGFSVGERKIDLKYAGGNLQDFADTLARKAKDIIGASIVSVTPDTRSLVIESLKTGEKNRLGFTGDAEKLALDAGLVERASSRAQNLDLAHPLPWTRPVDPGAVSSGGSGLSVATGGEAKLPLTPVTTTGLQLEVKYRLTKIPESPAPSAPPGPTIPETGAINYEGIKVLSAPSASGLPDWIPPPTPPRIDDSQMLFALAPDNSSLPLASLSDSAETATLRIELAPLLPDLAGVGLRNRDSSRRLEIVSVRVFDPNESGGLKPKRPISTAGDALFSIDGVEASRDTNSVADMIPGVTLQLNEASDKPVKVAIEPDRKSAKDAIIALVGTYNKLMGWMNILTRNDPSVVAQLDYFTDAEKKTANERLGLFLGNSTLSVLRDRLQTAMSNPYTTRLGADLRLLSQIGISTDSRQPGSGQGLDTSRLKGYLEIDETVLDKALAANFGAVRDLFGNATGGDLIVNSGVAYVLENAAKPYVETGGIFSTLRQTLDTQVTSTKKTIANLDDALAAKQADLKTKYGMMEGALNSMESTSTSIDNFTKNSGG